MSDFYETETAPVIRELAFAATEPSTLEVGRVHAFVAGGQVQKVDLTGDEYRDHPRRRFGTVVVQRAASFAHYWGKHSTSGSDIFADLDKAVITAVLDAHTPEHADWQKHRITFQLQPTDAWTAWTSRDGQLVGQADFAEFLEDRAGDVAPGGNVSSAELLEVVQSFQAHTNIEFKSGTRLSNGQTQFAFVENIEAKAGNRGQIEVPNEFWLAIRPFDDCQPVKVRVRFRYRLREGALTLGYKLEDPAGVAQRAVQEVTDLVSEQCGDQQESEHIVVFGETEFTVRHPLRERRDDALMDCELYKDIAAMSGPPVKPGTYRARWADHDAATPGYGRWTWEEVPRG